MKRSNHFLLSLLAVLATCGCTSFPDTAKIDAEGKAFATKIMEEQKPHWDAQAMEKYIPGSNTNAADLNKLIQRYSEGLGDPTSVSAFEGSYKVQAGINVPDYQGAYKAELTCTKGKGTVNLSVAHKDGKWFMTNFNVISSDLAPHDREREAFVKEVATAIAKSWRTEDLNTYGSKLFKKQYKEAELPMKAMFAGARSLGAFKSCRDSKFLGIGEFQGADTFSYEVLSDYEKGEANMMITVTKEGSKWRLAGFRVQGRSGMHKS